MTIWPLVTRGMGPYGGQAGTRYLVTWGMGSFGFTTFQVAWAYGTSRVLTGGLV